MKSRMSFPRHIRPAQGTHAQAPTGRAYMGVISPDLIETSSIGSQTSMVQVLLELEVIYTDIYLLHITVMLDLLAEVM